MRPCGVGFYVFIQMVVFASRTDNLGFIDKTAYTALTLRSLRSILIEFPSCRGCWILLNFRHGPRGPRDSDQGTAPIRIVP